MSHLTAYNYEIDIPFFRLLNPDYEKFIGRWRKIQDLKTALLELRQPVIALDGIGGVGKTAIAVEAVRELYRERHYQFIISLSAKSRTWAGYTVPRTPTFAALHSLLREIAAVLRVGSNTDDTDTLKRELVTLMKGERGLIVVDNLEEIDDPSVFEFIRTQIPDPVKVLITSRVEKDVGALTISIPAMTLDEARELIREELDRMGYDRKAEEMEYERIILEAAGGVPLAIKWAVQIARDGFSLQEAARTLRGAGTRKREFLSFCFSTMYDKLELLGKEAAALIPYLEAEWNPITISIALDKPVEDVKRAIQEISDRGIIYRARDKLDNAEINQKQTGAFGVLPLTRDFLLGKWNENHNLRRRVSERLSEAFALETGGEWLLECPLDRRKEHFGGTNKKKNSEKGVRKRTEFGGTCPELGIEHGS